MFLSPPLKSINKKIKKKNSHLHTNLEMRGKFTDEAVTGLESGCLELEMRGREYYFVF